MFARRLLVLVAVLMGLTALAASLSPPREPRGRNPSAPTATPSPTPSASATPGPGATVRAQLSTSGAARDVRAAVGDLVDLVVTGDVVDTVSIPGLAILEPIDPASPADVQLYADTAGRYQIRLLQSDRRIGTLVVSG